MPEFLAGHIEAAEDRGFKGRVLGTFILYVPSGSVSGKESSCQCRIDPGVRKISWRRKWQPDGIPVELFQILKDDAVKVLHSIYQQIWKTQQWPQDWKRSVFILIPKRSSAKDCLKYCTIALILHASKVML